MSRLASGWAAHMPGIALAVARLYVGYWLVMTGIAKIQRGFLQGGVLLPQLQREQPAAFLYEKAREVALESAQAGNK